VIGIVINIRIFENMIKAWGKYICCALAVLAEGQGI
jgi:hypothetical protein